MITVNIVFSEEPYINYLKLFHPRKLNDLEVLGNLSFLLLDLLDYWDTSDI